MISDAAHSILVVDDDQQMRRLYDRSLTSAGYACSLAADGAEARQLLAADGFSLVICDLRMPGESGLEVIREIQAQHRDTAVLMATGEDDPMVAEIASDRGAHGYLVKPFSRNQLLISVANGLYRRRLEQDNRLHRERLEQAVDERTAELRAAIEGLRLSQIEAVHRLSRAVEMRDLQTGVHIERIGDICGMLAAHLGIPDERIELLRIAAPMHDVGKIGIPDRILLKPDELTSEERVEMQRHTEIGHGLLAGSRSELLDLAATIALTHHEWIDGSGYPRGLAGEEIPIEGRIVAVADVLDALVCDRVYRPAYSFDAAVSILKEGSGTQFDPEILDVLLANLDVVAAGYPAA